MLLNAGGKAGQRSANGYLPLLAACYNGFNDTAELLLRHKADVGAVRSSDGGSALMLASQKALNLRTRSHSHPPHQQSHNGSCCSQNNALLRCCLRPSSRTRRLLLKHKSLAHAFSNAEYYGSCCSNKRN